MTGRLLERGQPAYEAARTGPVFNARVPERHPAAILLAEDDADVVFGVREARRRGLAVAVRSGGHSWAAWGLREDSLLLDLGAMSGLSFDPATGVATTQPAARGGRDLAPFLAARGRAFPGGHCESVGLGGFLLQGGQGWNSRAWGWACEHVIAVDVVTADGELLRADENQNADLLWAARGAGPGFPGVITRFHLRTHPRPAAMVQDTSTYHVQDTAELLEWLHTVLPTLDSTVEPVLAATRLPDVPLDDGVARPEGTVLVLHTTVMGESRASIDRLLRPLEGGPMASRRLGHVRGDTDIASENVAQTLQNPVGYRYAVDCTWTDAPAGVLAPQLERLFAELPTEHSFSIWYGWAPTRPLPDMAFSVESNVYLATYAIYRDAGDDDRHRDWLHTRMAELSRSGTGVYVGDTDFTRRNDRFMTDANFARLQAIRATRDPDGLFCSYLTAEPAGLNVH